MNSLGVFTIYFRPPGHYYGQKEGHWIIDLYERGICKQWCHYKKDPKNVDISIVNTRSCIQIFADNVLVIQYNFIPQ